MRAHSLAATVATLALMAACAPVIEGRPPVTLPTGLQETAQIGSITVSSGWLDAESDFTETFTDEVHQELNRCMWGSYPLNLRIHLEDLERAGRLDMLVTGSGHHILSGTVEFVDPRQGNRVIGRFPVKVQTDAGGRLEGLLGDRQMMVSEAFGRAVCDEAFGRNPRGPAVTNATRD